MRRLFADSAYWIALLNPRDSLHKKALTASADIGDSAIVTSEMVFTEVLNYFAASGPALRRMAAEFVEGLSEDKGCIVVQQTPALFRHALNLYKQRIDKGWSLTDCGSMSIMLSEDIQEGPNSRPPLCSGRVQSPLAGLTAHASGDGQMRMDDPSGSYPTQVISGTSHERGGRTVAAGN